MTERDEVAAPEPEGDQTEETEVAEDEAEQVKGGPRTVSFLPSVG